MTHCLKKTGHSYVVHYMVADIQNPPTLNEKCCTVQPISPQPQPYNDNNLSLLVDRKSSILKLNRLVYLII